MEKRRRRKKWNFQKREPSNGESNVDTIYGGIISKFFCVVKKARSMCRTTIFRRCIKWCVIHEKAHTHTHMRTLKLVPFVENP